MGVKKTKRYQADLKKVLAKSTKGDEDGADKASEIASILQSEFQRQINASTGSKAAPSVASSELEFQSALNFLFQSKDKSK